ncbi:hypothetical protein GOP47_0005725, partial [Adiantum capillus-veneris]
MGYSGRVLTGCEQSTDRLFAEYRMAILAEYRQALCSSLLSNLAMETPTPPAWSFPFSWVGWGRERERKKKKKKSLQNYSERGQRGREGAARYNVPSTPFTRIRLDKMTDLSWAPLGSDPVCLTYPARKAGVSVVNRYLSTVLEEKFFQK